MSAYAAWLDDLLAPVNPGLPSATGCRSAAESVPSGQRLPLEEMDPRRLILVADYHPSPKMLKEVFGNLPGLIALPLLPAQPLANVAYTTFRTWTNPLEWGSEAEEAIRAGADTVAFFLPSDQIRGKTLLRLGIMGVKRCLLPRKSGGFTVVNPFVQAFLLKAHSLAERCFSRHRANGEDAAMTPDECRAFLAAIGDGAASIQGPKGNSLRIAHFVNSLNSGGAERQACNAAVAQKRAGHEVRILLRHAPVGEDGHYLPLLEPHGIQAFPAGVFWQNNFSEAWEKRGIDPALMARLPIPLRRMVMDLAGELLADPVDVLHCYVDDCNIVGLIAARIARTPAIVLSMRNGNPTNFPGLFQPWMKPWYHVAADLEGVVFSSNSQAGARDYEDWLGLSPAKIGVIRNAFIPPRVPSALEVARLRWELGIREETPVIAGVFRLHPEKRPLTFLAVIDALRKRVPSLRVLLVGVGILEEQVRKEIDRLGLDDVISVLGQRQDVPVIMAASDVFLLVSEWEGTPNAVIEAQHVGCVPVVTDAGGSAEAMEPGVTGLLVDQHDLAGIVARVAGLLRQPRRRATMARAGKDFVAARFSPKAAHEDTITLYREVLANGRETRTPRLPHPAGNALP